MKKETPTGKLLKEIQEVLEPINEMSKAFVDDNFLGGITVWVENPTRFNNKYFKLYNSSKISSSTACARISLLNPKYLYHSGLPHWDLGDGEKRELCKLLSRKSKKFPGITNWQLILARYNDDNFNLDDVDFISGNYNEDDYPEAFPIDYPMPDYTQLK